MSPAPGGGRVPSALAGVLAPSSSPRALVMGVT